jgi:hypothetical protein
MKKSLVSVFVLGLAYWMFHLSGCGGDPQPDPCLVRKQTKAGFRLGEHVTWYGPVDTVLWADTMLAGNNVLFEADSDYLSYEWKVGSDPRTWKTKKFELRFDEPEQQLVVRLIAKWKPDLECFPLDDGVDTVYRNLTVIDYYQNPILGVYRGYVKSNPTDFFDVTVTLENISEPSCDCSSTPKYCSCGYIIRNINKGCESFGERVYPLDVVVGYRHLSFGWDLGQCQNYGCKAPKGWLRVEGKASRKAFIEFSTLSLPTTCNQVGDKRTKDIFYGNRQN